MTKAFDTGLTRHGRSSKVATVKPGCLVAVAILSISLGFSAPASAGGSRTTPPIACATVAYSPVTFPTAVAVGMTVAYPTCPHAIAFPRATTSEGQVSLNGGPPPGHLNAPVVGIAGTGYSQGYWLVGADGGVFAFDGAGFFGSAATVHLNAPIVGIASTPDGQGYYLVASDGGVFAFGDAVYQGSMVGRPLNAAIVGIATDPLTGGYRLVSADGGVFDFGAPYLGSMAGAQLVQPMVGIATDAITGGYWLVASDGGVFAFGPPFYGSWVADPYSRQIVGIAAAPGGQYFILDRSGHLADCSAGTPDTGSFAFTPSPTTSCHAGAR